MTAPTASSYVLICRDVIDANGYMIQAYVSPGEDRPALFYTIGLTDADLPELVIADIDEAVGPALLTAAADYQLEYRDLRAGDRWAAPATAFTGRVWLKMGPVRFRHPALEFAYQVYGRHQVNGLQLLWPDHDACYPGDRGFEGFQRRLH